MTQLISHLRKPFLVWLFANILGFGVLGIVALMIPYLGSAPGFFWFNSCHFDPHQPCPVDRLAKIIPYLNFLGFLDADFYASDNPVHSGNPE